jgi:DNA-directed RNA polymerase subunit RPC12/RpoP
MGGMTPEPEIECVDCGGRCFLLSHAPHEGFEPGDVVAYRCSDCLDRWDLVLPEDEAELAPPPPPKQRRRRGGPRTGAAAGPG